VTPRAPREHIVGRGGRGLRAAAVGVALGAAALACDGAPPPAAPPAASPAASPAARPAASPDARPPAPPPAGGRMLGEGGPEAPLEASRAPALPPVEVALPRSILLVSVDTLRRDHVSLYGYPRATTPGIDAFFADATVYERAYAAGAKTPSSVVSLLSGLYPQRHGVRLFFQRIGAEVLLLPDQLEAAGYQTAAVVSNLVLTGEAIGLSTRFGHYDDFVDERERSRAVYERRASRTTDAALRWLREERDPSRPHLLWVHYIDPHGPYDPPDAPGRTRFEHAEPRPIDLARVHHYVRLPGVTDGLEYVDRYDEEIAYADREVRRLLDGYAQQVGLDESIVVFTADHGETMLEHEIHFHHGHHVWEAVMAVPLMIRWPDGRGERVARPVSLVDLTPTLLEALGHPARPGGPGAPGYDGRPLRLRRGGPRDFLSLEASAGTHQYRALLRGDRKWFALVDRNGRIARRWFVDLASDPGERSEAPWPPSPVARTLAAWVHADPDPGGMPRDYLGGVRIDAPKVAPGRSAEELEALRALGYVE